MTRWLYHDNKDRTSKSHIRANVRRVAKWGYFDKKREVPHRFAVEMLDYTLLYRLILSVTLLLISQEYEMDSIQRTDYPLSRTIPRDSFYTRFIRCVNGFYNIR